MMPSLPSLYEGKIVWLPLKFKDQFVLVSSPKVLRP